MHMLDETWQILLLLNGHLCFGVHVLVRLWRWRVRKYFDMLRPLYQVALGSDGVQLILAQHLGEAANAPDRNNQCIHHGAHLLRTLVHL